MIVTYDLLFDILRYEKSKEDLQPLDPNFYSEVIEYLKNKESILINSQTTSAERELTKLQISNIKKILSELYERREKKIISLASYRIKTDSVIINSNSMLEEEKSFFDNISKLLKNYRDGILENVLNLRNTNTEFEIPESQLRKDKNTTIEKNTDTSLNSNTIKSIRFIKPVPRFLGPEMENYGPFESEDIASLPSRVADILIRKDRAEEIKID